MGQSRAKLPPRRLALFSAALAGSALALTGCGQSAGPSVTTIARASGAVVIDSHGHRAPAVNGERIGPGDAVLSGAGRPVLLYRGRATWLGRQAQVTLLAADSYLLDSGSVAVDRRRGPDLTVLAGGATVSAEGPSALRIDRGFAVRVAVYSGAARVAVSELSRTVPALYEVQLPGGALPSTNSPLALADDALDSDVAGALVAADRQIDAAAASLDLDASAGAGRAVAASVVRAAAASPVPDLFGEPVSERLLPVAIAAAAHGSCSAVRAHDLRSAGGSWAVVTALCRARTTDVLSSVTAWQDSALGPFRIASGPEGPAQGPVAAVPAGPAEPAFPPAGGTGSGPGAPAAAVTAQPSPSPDPSPRPGAGSGTGSGTGSGAGPSSSAGSSPSPGPVQQLVDTVTGLLSASPSPSPSVQSSTTTGLVAGLLVRARVVPGHGRRATGRGRRGRQDRQDRQDRHGRQRRAEATTASERRRSRELTRP